MRATAAFLIMFCTCVANAALSFLPRTHHHLYQTYGLFTEEQMTFVFREGSRAWAAMGDSFAIAEADWPGKPQLLLTGSINVSFLSKGSLLDFNVETFDARFGLATEWDLGDGWRLQVGTQHNSGHAADGIKDPSLNGPNLGQDCALARVVHDWRDQIRVGGTFAYFLGTDPDVKSWRLDQFAEFFPWGSVTNGELGARPYLALGTEEYGVSQYEFTYHIQAGLLLGNHFQTDHRQSLRLVVGYYHGVDPRLKYAVFFRSKWDFVYAGFMLNL